MNAETIINKQNRNNGKIEAIITNADQEVWSNKKRSQFSTKAPLAFLKIFYLVPNFITVQIQPIVYLYFKYLSSLNGEKTRLQMKFYFIHNLIPFVLQSFSFFIVLCNLCWRTCIWSKQRVYRTCNQII